MSEAGGGQASENKSSSTSGANTVDGFLGDILDSGSEESLRLALLQMWCEGISHNEIDL